MVGGLRLGALETMIIRTAGFTTAELSGFVPSVRLRLTRLAGLGVTRDDVMMYLPASQEKPKWLYPIL